MPYQVTKESDLVRITLTGSLTAADLHHLAATVSALGGELPVTPHLLTDLRSSTGVQLDFAAVLDFANERTAAVMRQPITSALIAPDPIHYGFARMFQTFNQNPSITVAIFPNEEDAREWLAAPGLAPPAAPWAPSGPLLSALDNKVAPGP